MIWWMFLGERQGCMFAPALFCIAIDLILERMSPNHDVSIWPAHCIRPSLHRRHLHFHQLVEQLSSYWTLAQPLSLLKQKLPGKRLIYKIWDPLANWHPLTSARMPWNHHLIEILQQLSLNATAIGLEQRKKMFILKSRNLFR